MKVPRTAVVLAMCLALLLGPAATCCAAEEPSAEARAQQILDAAGLAGGLIVHLDCGTGRLTAALGRSGRFVVRGLARDEAVADEARRTIADAGPYGRTSVGLWDGRTLPFRDNLANLIVAEGPLGTAEADALRALAPGGVLLVRTGDGWKKTVKRRPENIDEWTHFLHGPDNNAVARDRVVGPPAHLQWIADPVHLRSHEHLNSVSAVVSAGGRIFTILDEGPTAAVVAPSAWRLVARDAFNGLLLWKHDLGPWEGHMRLFRSGPPEIARRLVAQADAVYVTLGYGKAVAALDAATGRPLRTYDATAGALEIVFDTGRLFVVVGDIDMTPPADPALRFHATPPPRDKGLVALDAASGRVLWTRKDGDTAALMPTTLAIADGRLFFQNTREILCLDAATGAEQWRADRPVYTTRLAYTAPTLVVAGGVVLSADGSSGGLPGDANRGEGDLKWILSDQDIRQHPAGDLVALDAATGRPLWTGKSLQGFCNPGDLFVIGDRIYAGANVSTKQADLSTAVDLRTGQVRSRQPNTGLPVGGHTRCYRNKATERFLVLGGIGVEFVDVTDWSWNANPWVRGTCQYGVMPCNGLLYSPPDSCACQPEARLHGFTAMAPAQASETRAAKAASETTATQTAPAPAPAATAAPSIRNPPARAVGTSLRLGTRPGKSEIQNDVDWPTYRHDAARTGRTAARVPAHLAQAWRTELGGRLTSPTVAAGKVFVARSDAHTVYALDADTGRIAWSRTVGGPVDSPPTVHDGLVLFGCRDGHVYGLRADDGELVWRFRAAPEERYLVAHEAVESAWPVSGSVLVRDGLAWFVAGRSPFLDGGLRLFAVEAASGKPVVTKRLDSSGPEGFQTSKAGAADRDRTPPMLPDILSASDDLIYMRWMAFDPAGEIVRTAKPHLFSSTGFLDDTWWHRTYWQVGTWMRGGFGGWPQAAQQTPAGRLMVVDDEALYGFGRSHYDAGNPNDVHAGHVGLVKDTYQDSGRIDYARNPYRLFAATLPGAANAAGKGKAKTPTPAYRWQTPVPMLVRGMVLAGETLFVAGPPAGEALRGLADLNAAGPALLWAVSPADGTKVADCPLPASPVLDGVAAVPGRLLVVCVDGSVCCLAGAKPAE